MHTDCILLVKITDMGIRNESLFQKTNVMYKSCVHKVCFIRMVAALVHTM